MLNFRIATFEDIELYFDWANDPYVRGQSYNSDVIDFENHKKWFVSKLQDMSCLMLVFQDKENINIGQIRIQIEKKREALIGVSIASEHRGKGYAKEMLQIASEYFLDYNPNFLINAYIKENNSKSKYAFEKAGFEYKGILNYENFRSFHYTKGIKNENRCF